jgi:hypothetical protein
MSDYHTALAGQHQRWPALDRFECAAGVAFRHDLTQGLPVEFDQADVLYADLPWRQGWDTFAQRAGTAQRGGYNAAMRGIGGLLRACNKPAVMVTGKHAQAALAPDSVAPVRLNGGDAVACLWGVPPWRHRLDASDLLADLAGQYRCVGDPCCGYGRAGRLFAQRGRRFVLSDLNPECIGYIAAHAAGWA